MPKLKYIASYEVPKFDTPDGDLHKGQYAVIDGKHLVRDGPENNTPLVWLEKKDRGEQEDVSELIAEMTEIAVLPEKMYFRLFELPDGRMFRVEITKEDYASLSIKHTPVPEKTLTDIQITNAKKDDGEWEKIRNGSGK